MRGFWFFLFVFQMAVLFPANLYFGFTGTEWSFGFAFVNLIGSYWALLPLLND